MRCPHPHRWKCTQTIPKAPSTIGQHLKNRRLQLHWFQADVGRLICVSGGSIQNWERGISEPSIRHLPKIIEFLGYNPEPTPRDLPRRLVYARRILGLTQERLARALRIDPTTIWRWERGDCPPMPGKLRLLQSMLGAQFEIG